MDHVRVEETHFHQCYHVTIFRHPYLGDYDQYTTSPEFTISLSDKEREVSH